jgi:peptidoglycan/LPS O-acetylase OafA/YrhL
MPTFTTALRTLMQHATQETLPTPTQSPPRPHHAERRIPAFDGMRGIAVLLVIICHVGIRLPPAKAVLGWWGSGGVDVFFTLSGYLITVLLLDERTKIGHVSLKNFYARRALRLLPALFLLVLLYLAFSPFLNVRPLTLLQECAATIFYAANWALVAGFKPPYLAHSWSLSIEEQFYLIWPFVVILLHRSFGRSKKAALLCLALGISLTLWRNWLTTHGASPLRVYFGLDTHGEGLVYGATVAFFLPKLPKILAAIVVCIVLTGFILFLSHYAITPWMLAWSTLSIVIAIVNSPKGLFALTLSFPPIVWLGKISYGLYLFHYPILLYLIRQGWSPTKVALIGVPLSLAVATISFYALERPCLKLKSHFRSRADADPQQRKAAILHTDPVST